MVERNKIIQRLSLHLLLNFNTKFISEAFKQKDMTPPTKPLIHNCRHFVRRSESGCFYLISQLALNLGLKHNLKSVMAKEPCTEIMTP